MARASEGEAAGLSLRTRHAAQDGSYNDTSLRARGGYYDNSLRAGAASGENAEQRGAPQLTDKRRRCPQCGKGVEAHWKRCPAAGTQFACFKHTTRTAWYKSTNTDAGENIVQKCKY
jgi:hypothetical protein